MSARQKIKFIHERQFVAEVTVDLIESDDSWSPSISLADACRLDDVRRALKAGDLKAAAQYGPVYELRPVASHP